MIRRRYFDTCPIARVRIELTRALPDLVLLVQHPDAVLLAIVRDAVREINDGLIFLALQVKLALDLERVDADLQEQSRWKDQDISGRVDDPLAED